MGESFHTVQHLDPPFLFMDERVIFIPRGRQLDVNNRMLKIILFLEGSIDLSVDAKRLGAVGPGDILVVPKPCRQIYRPLESKETRLHVLRIFFDFNALGLNLLSEGKSLEEKYDLEAKFAAFVRHHLREVTLLERFQDAFTVDCIRRIRSEVEAEEPGFRYMVSSHCRLLVTRLIRRIAKRNARPNLLAGERDDHSCWAVEHSKFFICENYNRPLDLGTIAWEVRLSAEHLARTFKKSTGQTVFEFLRDIRIESAKSYLISSKRSVAEISELVGFSSPTLLCRNFRKATGLSPTEFRHKSLKKLSFQRTTLTTDSEPFVPSTTGDEAKSNRRLSV